MNQKVPNELISAYFDGEVTAEERKEVERLLESSSEFRQELDETAKLSALLHSFPRELAPADLAANVQRRVDAVPIIKPAAPVQKRMRLRRDWLAFASGMCVPIVLVLIYVAANPLAPTNELPMREDEVALSRDKESTVAASMRWRSDVARKDAAAGAPDAFVTKHLGTPVAESVAPAPTVAMSADVKEALIPQGDIQSSGAFVDVNGGMQPLSLEDFLPTLKNGDVFVMKDPNESVPVLELTVVDVERGAEGLKLAFHKRSVNQFEDEASQSANFQRPDATKKKLNVTRRYNDSNDLMVIFVRASGDRLVDAISDARNDHPDLYRQTVPQLPLDLNLSSGTLVANNAVTGPVNGPIRESVKADNTNATTVQESFEVEADLVVKTYADLNGKAIDNSVAEVDKDARRKPRGQIAFNEMKNATKQAEDLPHAAATTLNESPAKTESSNVADKAVAENNDVLQGYKTFHVVLGKQQQPVDQQIPQARSTLAQQGAMSRNSAPTNNAYQGNGLNPMSMMMGNSVTANPGVPGSPRYGLRGGRGTSDNARLTRLLIVLKQEKPDAQPDNGQPAPPPNN